MLTLTFLLASGTLLAVAAVPAFMSGDIVDPPSAQAAAAEGEVLLVDIRRPEEWYQTGMAPDAVGVTWGEPDFVDGMRAAVEGDLTRPVVLICRTGGRTAQAMQVLRAAGFESVVHVAEGMIGSGYGPGWIARGLPTRRPE